jgi:pilus assembly protein CpaB
VNPRQRRGVLLMAIAVLGAGAVFVSVSQYVARVRDQVDDKVAVLRIAEDVEENRNLADVFVKEVMVPEKWVPDQVIRSGSGLDLGAFVAAANIPEGAYLQEGMFKPAPPVEPGEREVTILVDIEQGVGGKIQRGDVVDVVATFGGASDVPGCSAVVASDVPVVDYGFERTVQPDAEDGEFQEPEVVVPVNFALDPYHAQRLVLAESFANEIRLFLKSAISTEAEPDPTLKETYDCGPDLLSEKPPEPTAGTSATAGLGGDGGS